MKKQKLISDTGTGSKIIINLEVVEMVMNKKQKEMLKELINDMHVIENNLKLK